jgi:hypothetical protein
MACLGGTKIQGQPIIVGTRAMCFRRQGQILTANRDKTCHKLAELRVRSTPIHPYFEMAVAGEFKIRQQDAKAAIGSQHKALDLAA